MQPRERRSRFFLGKVVLALLALSLSFSAGAWNGTGHRLIAHIAWQQLSLEERVLLGNWLQRHPDYPHWLKHRPAYPGASPAYVAFVEASTWADDIRRQRHSFQEDSIPPFTETEELASHPDWHFQDGAHSGPGAGRLAEALETLPGQLKARGNISPLALVWLEHLVGDAHQPLHTWSRNLPSGQSDRGGNGLTLAGDDVSGREANLHTYWDELAGPRGLRGAALARRADALSLLCSKPGKVRAPAIWLQESRNLAITVAYGDLSPWPPVSLSPTYAARAQLIGDQQLCKAGKRLGALLQQLLTGNGFPQ